MVRNETFPQVLHLSLRFILLTTAPARVSFVVGRSRGDGGGYYYDEGDDTAPGEEEQGEDDDGGDDDEYLPSDDDESEGAGGGVGDGHDVHMTRVQIVERLGPLLVRTNSMFKLQEHTWRSQRDFSKFESRLCQGL